MQDVYLKTTALFSDPELFSNCPSKMKYTTKTK